MYRENPEIADDRQYFDYCLDLNGKSLENETMNEIKHPKTVQELLSNHLPDYSHRLHEYPLHKDYFHYQYFQEALENYRRVCEKSAWERACKKQREICGEVFRNCDRHKMYEVDIQSAIILAQAPEFETLK